MPCYARTPPKRRERAHDHECERVREIQQAKKRMIWNVNPMNHSRTRLFILATPTTSSLKVEIGLTVWKTLYVWLLILSQKLNLEIMEMKTLEFLRKVVHIVFA